MPPLTTFQADESLVIRKILDGEGELFYELIKPHRRSVYLAALAVLHNENDAEEVAQEAFLKSFRSLRTFRGEAKFGTWLRSIAVNEARMRIRKNLRGPTESLTALEEPGRDESAPYVPLELSDWREWPLEILERQEVRDAIRKSLAELSEKYRQVLIYRDINQLSVAETAELLGITAVTVKVRLLRARLKIRDLLVQSLGEHPLNARLPRRGKNPWS